VSAGTNINVNQAGAAARNHLQMHQRCDLICPDLPKVL
jgi:hypothetical protein